VPTAVPCHTPVLIVPTVSNEELTTPEPNVVADKTAVPLTLYSLPVATSRPDEDDNAPPSARVKKVTVLAPLLDNIFNPDAALDPTPTPAASELRSITLSSTLRLVESIKVVVPSTVKLPGKTVVVVAPPTVRVLAPSEPKIVASPAAASIAVVLLPTTKLLTVTPPALSVVNAASAPKAPPSFYCTCPSAPAGVPAAPAKKLARVCCFKALSVASKIKIKSASSAAAVAALPEIIAG